MLKQSLVQEKLSDLSNGSIAAAAANSLAATDLDGKPDVAKRMTTNRIKLNAVQSSASSILLSNRFNTSATLGRHFRNNTTAYESNTGNINYTSGSNNNNNDEDDNENVEFDGDETVNFYSNLNSNGRMGANGPSGSGPGGGNGGGGRGGDGDGNDKMNAHSLNSNFSGNSNDLNNNNSGTSNAMNSSVGPHMFSSNSNSSFKTNSKEKHSNQTNHATYNADFTMKLRYLEKSIKFIQQQHNETLSSLHQEIEKLKNENRGEFFMQQQQQINCLIRQNTKFYIFCNLLRFTL